MGNSRITERLRIGSLGQVFEDWIDVGAAHGSYEFDRQSGTQQGMGKNWPIASDLLPTGNDFDVGPYAGGPADAFTECSNTFNRSVAVSRSRSLIYRNQNVVNESVKSD